MTARWLLAQRLPGLRSASRQSVPVEALRIVASNMAIVALVGDAPVVPGPVVKRGLAEVESGGAPSGSHVV